MDLGGVGGGSTYAIMAPVSMITANPEICGTPDLPAGRRRLAVRHPGHRREGQGAQAAGEHVIGFGAGEPDFPTPDAIVEAAVAACRDPSNHRYTPTGGLPELREAIARKTQRDSGYEVTPAQVLVTNGGKQAVANAFAVLFDPGDEVLVPAPYWTTYPESIALAGGVPVVVPTDESTGFQVTVAQLERRDPADQGVAVRLAVQPDRRGLPRTRSTRSAAGRSSVASGS